MRPAPLSIGPGLACAVGVVLGIAWTSPTAPAALIVLCVSCALATVRSLRNLGTFCVALVLGMLAADLEARRVDADAARFPERHATEGSIEGRLEAHPGRSPDGARTLILRVTTPRRLATARVRLVVAPSPEDATRKLDRLTRGDRLRIWCRLARPSRIGNPTSRDPARWLASAGYAAVGSVKSARLVELVGQGAPGALRTVDRLARRLSRRLDRVCAGDSERRALLGAMVLGERTLPAQLQRRLRDSGLSHLVAISGLHVGIVAGVLLLSLRLLRWRGIGLVLALTLILGLFATLVGTRPSVMRAVGGAVLFVVARVSGRDGDALSGLGLLAALLLILRPAWLGGAGFQLSFAATGGLLMLMRTKIPRLPIARLPAMSALVSLVAYLATLPLVLVHFDRAAPAALPLNLIAVPLCGWILSTTYAAILATEIPLIGGLLADVVGGAVAVLLSLADLGAGWEWGRFVAPRPDPWVVGGYFAALWTVAVARGWARRAAVVVFVWLAAWVHLGPPPHQLEAPEARVIDVGQGQAVAVRRGGRALLVDAGGSHRESWDPGETEVVPSLLRMGVRRLELLVLSHEDVDHAGGARAILRDLEVGELWLGPGYHRAPGIAELVGLARRRSVAVVLVWRGARRTVGGMQVRVLAPELRSHERASNARSIVVMVGSAPSRLLIPGDLDQMGESRIIEREAAEALRAEALVVAHHGSRSSSSGRFLAVVAPERALISCGRANRFGHPHVETLSRLTCHTRTIHRTDRHGMLRLRARPDGWSADGWSTGPGGSGAWSDR